MLWISSKISHFYVKKSPFTARGTPLNHFYAGIGVGEQKIDATLPRTHTILLLTFVPIKHCGYKAHLGVEEATITGGAFLNESLSFRCVLTLHRVAVGN